MQGIEYLRQAENALTSSSGNARDRLLLAGREFWTAHFQLTSWTLPVQERSYSVTSKLLARGTVDKTVLRMSDDSINQATTLLSSFCRFAYECDRDDETEPATLLNSASP